MKFKSNVDIEAALAVSQNATFAGNVTIGDNSASEIFLAFNSSATDFALGANGSNFMIGTSSDLDSGNLITLSGTNGRLGIGTTSPSEKLDVVGNIELGDGGTGAALKYNSTNRGTILVNGSEIMRLEAAGNVGIGTTSPNEKLTVAGNIHAYAPSGINAGLFASTAAGATSIAIRSSGVTFFNAGNVGIGTNSPSQKLHVAGKGLFTDFVRFNGVTAPDFPVDIDAVDGGKSLRSTRGTSVFRIDQGNDGPGYIGMQSADDFSIQTNNTSKIYITSAGNVGVGTTSPQAALHVAGAFNSTAPTGNGVLMGFYSSSHGYIQLNGPSGGYIDFSTSGTDHKGRLLYDNTSNYMRFDTNGSEKMRINSAGNVGIGTTSPSTALEVIGDIKIKQASTHSNYSLIDASEALLTLSTYTVNASAYPADIKFSPNQTERMRITDDGNVGIGTTSPAAPLHVVGNILVQSGRVYTDELQGYSTNQITLGDGASTLNLISRNSQNLAITGGNVGIGTTSPNSKLDIRRSGSGVALELHQTSGSANDFVDLKMIAGSTSAGTLGTILRHKRDGTGGGDFSILTNPSLAGTPTEKLIVKSSGNVGIGTSSPGEKLEIAGYAKASTGFKLGNYGLLYINDNNVNLKNTAYYHINFHTNNAQRMRITNAGNVGIGTTAPAQKLEVAGNIKIGDSNVMYFGAGNDLQIYHDGSHTHMANFTGNLRIRQFADDSDIIFESDDGSGGTAEYFRVDGGITMNVFSKPTWYGDGVKSFFGNSQDLQIYHDGSNSYIKDAGSGGLRIASDLFRVYKADLSGLMINAVPDDRVELYFNDNKKFETTSTGVAVTGKITNLTAGTGNLDAVNVQQLNNATTGTLIYKGTWSAAPTTTSVLDGAVSSAGTIVIDAVNPGISVGATITGTGISGTVTVSNIAADGITIAISSAQTIADGVTLTFTTVGGTPDLSQASRKVTGHYYICETAGAVTPNGAGTTPNEWAVGDWATFSDLTTDAWQKIDNSSVLSGAGTGGKVPVWSGTGTSVTLADAPITVSGNHSSFTGDVLPLVNGGSNLGSNSKQWGSIYAGGIGASTVTLTTIKLNGSFSILNKAQNAYIGFATRNTSGSQTVMDLTNVGSATFAGNVTLNGDGKLLKFTPTSYDDVELGIDSNGFVIYNTTDSRYDLKISGTGNATFGGDVTVGDDVFLADGGVINLGTDNDLVLFHDGADAVIRNNTGHVFLDNFASDKDIYFRGKDGTTTITALHLDMSNGGSATFVDDIDLGGKITQTGTGNNTFGGNVTLSSTAPVLYLANTTSSTGKTWYFSSAPNGNAYITQDGVIDAITLSHTSGNATFGGDVSLPDNKKLILGAGDDLQIFHNGTASIIKDAGAGNLQINASDFVVNNAADTKNMIIAVDGGATTLFCNGAGKIATTSTGVSVTGNGIFTGNVNTTLVYGTTDLNLGYAGGTSGVFIKGSTALAGNVGIGTTAPKSKLQVAGGIQMAGDTAAASADKVGTMRYRTGTEHVEVNGTNIVTNGDFAADSNWTKVGDVAIASGVATFDDSGSNTNSYLQQDALTANKKYLIALEVKRYVAGRIQILAGTDVYSVNISQGVGSYSIYTSAVGSAVLRIKRDGSYANFDFDIDNVSAIEVTAEDASYADMCMQTGSSTYEWVNIVRNTY